MSGWRPIWRDGLLLPAGSVLRGLSADCKMHVGREHTVRTPKRYKTTALLGVIAWLVAGCTVSPSSTLRLSPLASVTTPSPTATPITIPTHRPTLSPTATRIPTPTLTPAPTLSAEVREAYVEELLMTNAGCKLPCWWGIVPGETTWVDAERFLAHIGVRIISNADSSGNVFHETGGFDFKPGISTSIDFWEHKGVVESIQIQTDSCLPENFKAVWTSYSPEQVISTYGQSSRVWVQTFAAPNELPYGDTMAYDLWLFYDELGFVIRYEGQARYEPVYRLCPTFEEGGNLGLGLEMYLQSPANPRPLEELVGERMGIPESIHSIEEAAGLSVEDFCALFTRGEGPICLETPRDIWP